MGSMFRHRKMYIRTYVYIDGTYINKMLTGGETGREHLGDAIVLEKGFLKQIKGFCISATTFLGTEWIKKWESGEYWDV